MLQEQSRQGVSTERIQLAKEDNMQRSKSACLLPSMVLQENYNLAAQMLSTRQVNVVYSTQLLV